MVMNAETELTARQHTGQPRSKHRARGTKGQEGT